MNMKDLFKKLGAGFCAALLIVGVAALVVPIDTAQAADVNAPINANGALITGKTINAGTVSNYTQFPVIDCSRGKDLYISASYMVATNYATTAAFASTLTNLTFVFQAGDGLGNWGANGTSASGVEMPVTWTLTVPGNTISLTNFAFTNLTINAMPFVRLRYITNAAGNDANCKATNVNVSYWVK